MSRIAYVDGRYLPLRDAVLSVDDRGTQFADAIYEVVMVRGGRLLDEALHLDRMERSLRELRIPMPMSRRAVSHVIREVLRRNHLADCVVYLQISRGVAPRDHGFPHPGVRPSLLVTARPNRGPSAAALAQGVRVISMPDLRWARCDIKSTSLLPNILAKQAARDAGAYEAWLIDRDGCVTEGSSTNAWIVDAAGALITRPVGADILSGVTRLTLIRLARAAGLTVVERPFTLDEAKGAAEAFLSSASSFVLPIVRIDDAVIADGRPGAISQRLRALYLAEAAAAPSWTDKP